MGFQKSNTKKTTLLKYMKYRYKKRSTSSCEERYEAIAEKCILVRKDVSWGLRREKERGFYRC